MWRVGWLTHEGRALQIGTNGKPRLTDGFGTDLGQPEPGGDASHPRRITGVHAVDERPPSPGREEPPRPQRRTRRRLSGSSHPGGASVKRAGDLRRSTAAVPPAAIAAVTPAARAREGGNLEERSDNDGDESSEGE